MDVDVPHLPAWAAAQVVDLDEALRRCVTTGTVLGFGLATSEPTSLLAAMWDHVVRHDVTDLEVRNGLYLAPHPLLVGDALDDVDLPLPGLRAGGLSLPDPLRGLVDAVSQRAEQAVRLRRLADHVDELERRSIRLRSAFLGPVLQRVVPDTAVTRALAPRLAGRNRVTAGTVDYQPVHFPDAAWALGRDPDTQQLELDVYAVTAAWPDEHGWCSFGMSNGVDGDAVDELLAADAGTLLVLLNRRQPRVPGAQDDPNGLLLDRLRPLADAGRLVLVVEDVPVPGVPTGAFGEPEGVGADIGRIVARHVVDHLEVTDGRALQVGIGETSVAAVRALSGSPWTGSVVTEMLDPVTFGLLEDGTAAGDALCTFAMGEQDSDFPQRLAASGRVRMLRASRFFAPDRFHGGLGINNVLGVDLVGHVNATGRGPVPHSGVGGLATIARGLALGGVSYLCLRSTYTDGDGEQRSTIVPTLEPGTPVALTPFDLMGTRSGARVFLATEHGVAPLHGRPAHELAAQLVSVAHPDHRDELGRAARELHGRA